MKVSASIDQAYAIDEENGDHNWRDAIQKEMPNVIVTFKILEKGQQAPPTYQRIDCNLIFDVKMDFN